jgi:uncharacterized membrane protein YczE
MKLALNFVKLILLSAWVGATLFFGAVVAPAAFGVLRSFELPNANEIAGSIVTRCVSVVNITGFIIGLFILLCFFLTAKPKGLRFLFELLSAGVFVLATGVGHWVIAARMRALRVAMSLPIDQVRPDDPRRIEFNNLHVYSVNTLLLAMIAALVAIILISIRIKNLKIED